MHAQAAAEALPMTGLPDARAAAGQLIRQATGGDLEAFEELVRRLQRRVYGFAYQHLRDLDEAHDLTQEIFVKLFRNLARYDAEPAPSFATRLRSPRRQGSNERPRVRARARPTRALRRWRPCACGPRHRAGAARPPPDLRGLPPPARAGGVASIPHEGPPLTLTP